ncbi:MAG TPA: hypothetical protein VMU02_07310 [bacterium]|nr:hypothetical protein [bacterium]
MKLLAIGLAAILLATTASASGEYHPARQLKAFQMREDYGTAPLSDCYMNYYYYIPCPTNSWFWMFEFDWPGDMAGVFYTIGDPSMGSAGAGCPPYVSCDPCGAHVLEQFRILDYAGYGTLYPGLFTVKFDVWCCDELGCPVGPSLWTSGPVEFCNAGWNYVQVTPQLCLTNCYTQLQGPTKCYPRFLITQTSIGTCCTYPAWGVDNISSPLKQRCAMHDVGCCPALYPRPLVSYYSRIHTGIYRWGGTRFCPPFWLMEPADTVGNVLGYLELAWRVYLKNIYTNTEPSTWGSIKSMYK